MHALFLFTTMFPAAAPVPPPLQAEAAIIDCNEVKAGVPLARTFKLRNRGNLPIEITEVTATCGCLRPALREPNAVPGGPPGLKPGDPAEIYLKINTLSQPDGVHQWTTTVRYMHGDEKGVLELHLRAKIVHEVLIEPVALGLTIDGPAAHVFTLTDRRARPLRIVAASASSKDIHADVLGVDSNSRGEHTQQVRIRVSAEFPAGRSVETLTLKTNDEEYPELSVPITITRHEPGQVMATPSHSDLRLARGQKAASELLRLRDNDGKTVVVDRLEANDPAIQTRWAPGPGSMATVRIGVTRNAAAAFGKGEVKVYIKEPRAQVLVIPVTWQE